MSARSFALLVASSALVMTGVTGASTAVASESSAAALSCGNRQYFSSDGYAGGSIRCTGTAFVAKATCYKPGYGNYTHYGNRVESGGTSTVWCDRDATMPALNGLSS